MNDNRSSCRDFGDKLILYHYGELPKEEASEVASHVLSCAPCRKSLEELSLMLANVPEPKAPTQAEVHAAAQGIYAKLFRRKASSVRKLAPVYLAAAAVIAAVFTAAYLPDFGNHEARDVQVATNQADWEVLDNMDVIGDLDVIHQMDQNGLDEIGPIRD